MTITQPPRRTHSEAFKQSLIEACDEPGASVAGVALANGINANQLRRWMREWGIEPPELPRTEIHHEPASTSCACGCQMKRIGEDVAEKLDYTPAPSASSAMSAASGSARRAKPWCRPRCRPT